MLKPLRDRVILKFVEEQETTKSGLVLPSNAKEKSGIAEVIAVGPGVNEFNKEIVMTLKVGDKVICSKYLGTEIKYENQEYIILKQEDVLAIIE
jgi:chaperonin GroES